MNQLQKVEHNQELVLTTEQLAEVYETDVKNIQMNFANNREKFIEGKHFHLLQGADLQDFKNQPNIIGVVHKQASSLYLWTKQGASRHCKMLGTDRAWDQFDMLEESYFNPKNQLANLSPQLQLLINIELEQKEIKEAQAKQSQEIAEMRNVVSLSSNDWRRETGNLLKQMALKCDGFSMMQELRAESYRLLDERMGVCVQTRLVNKRRRMAEEGISVSKRNQLNNLDVIGDDKKLIEGYVAIVKEMAIKYGVGKAS